MIVNYGERETLKVSGKSISGFTLMPYAVHTTANTAFSATLLDLEQVIVKATLKGRGKDHIIYSDVALPLIASSAFYNAGFGQALDGTSTVLRAKASGVDEIAMQFYKIDFGTTINLKGNECVEIEIYVPSGSAGTGVSTSESYVEVNYLESIGYEYGTPEIITKSVSPNQSRIQMDLGDNVVDVTYTNTDKVDVLEASAPIESISFFSDRISISDNWFELLNKRWGQFDNSTEADNRHNCYKIFSGESADDVSIDFTLDTSNITAGKNYVVAKKLHVTGGHLNRVSSMKAKHDREFISKVK